VCALALLLFGQCQRNEAPRASAPTPGAADAARPMAEPPGAPPVAGAPPPPPPDDAIDGGAPPASKGSWLEGNVYRFRLDDVRTCAPPTPPAVARIGAVVRVTSKIDGLMVAPRDVKLESGGVILESAISPQTSCAPLLTPKSLRAGKSTDGLVVFDIPPGFNPEHRPVKVTYQPTRWGGAKRVEALLPAESLPR
jgi:hypothetical protein